MRRATTIFVILALFAFGFVCTASASNISKTFEFGPGTQNTRSVFRTYPVPCGRQVAAVVKFSRLGTAGASNDIPIIIELREPETAPGVEGPVVETKNVKAQTTEQSVTIFSPGGGSARGCALPWRVRVRYALDGTPPFAVHGTARLDYDGRDVSIPSEQLSNVRGHVFHAGVNTFKIGDAAGLKQGRIVVTADWYHSLGHTVPLPGDVRLKFQLMNPSGTVVQTAEGYDSDGGPSPRFKLTHQVPSCTPGQWKVKVTNLSNTDDVVITSVKNQFTPGCE